MQPIPVTITHMHGAEAAASDKQWSSDQIKYSSYMQGKFKT
jgi:hypothetical protein